MKWHIWDQLITSRKGKSNFPSHQLTENSHSDGDDYSTITVTLWLLEDSQWDSQSLKGPVLVTRLSFPWHRFRTCRKILAFPIQTNRIESGTQGYPIFVWKDNIKKAQGLKSKNTLHTATHWSKLDWLVLVAWRTSRELSLGGKEKWPLIF
jgi:hypothetical protein